MSQAADRLERVCRYALRPALAESETTRRILRHLGLPIEVPPPAPPRAPPSVDDWGDAA